MTTEEIFKMYDLVGYIAFKYSITIPATVVGNVMDLFLFGIPKRAIDVTPLMTNFPFFRQHSIDIEKSIADSSLLNKGFAGVFRAAATTLAEIPANIASLLFAVVMTALHLIIANTIAVPVVAVAEFVGRNMLGV